MTESYEGTRRAMERAIRRLNALEYLILGGAVLVALIAGAVAALLLHSAAGFPFFLSWVVLSLLLFIIPAVVVLRREMAERRGEGDSDPRPDSPGRRPPPRGGPPPDGHPPSPGDPTSGGEEEWG